MPEGEALWSGSVTHRFFGDTLLFLGFSSSFCFGTMKTKELGLFFFLNLAARKKEDKRRNVFLFFHLFALCADRTLVALTAGFNFFFLFGWEGQQGKKRNPEKRRILVNTGLSAISNSSTVDWVHFNFSLVTHLFLSSRACYLFVQSALCYETIQNITFPTAQGINRCFWFQVKVPLSSPSPPPQVLKPRAGRWTVLVILLISSTFFFF